MRADDLSDTYRDSYSGQGLSRCVFGEGQGRYTQGNVAFTPTRGLRPQTRTGGVGLRARALSGARTPSKQASKRQNPSCFSSSAVTHSCFDGVLPFLKPVHNGRGRRRRAGSRGNPAAHSPGERKRDREGARAKGISPWRLTWPKKERERERGREAER